MAQIFYGTDGTVPSSWTTGTRPAAPATGQFGYNTTIGSLEIYNGSAWGSVGGGGPGTVSIQSSNFTAVSGYVYPVNTTSGAVTVTLPASPVAGNFVTIIDYANNFATNNCIIARNGSNIAGTAVNTTLSVSGTQLTLIYADSTKGWLQASGNTNTFIGGYAVTVMAVGGGGGSGELGGGGGGGGMITTSAIAAPGTSYSIIIGAGGAGGNAVTNNGVNTTGLGVTALGGGYGAYYAIAGGNGGSGGGGSRSVGTPGSGTAGQGNNGGAGGGNESATGGGGGAGAAGQAFTGSSAGAGGAGAASSISGSSITYAGGGGGGGNGTYSAGSGGSGGGANGTSSNGGSAASGTANRGGGGGGGPAAGGTGGSGGSGILYISYPGVQRGSGGSYAFIGGNSIHTFVSSSTYTA